MAALLQANWAKIFFSSLFLGAVFACSLAVDTTATQCEKDADCADFPGTSCVSGGCVAQQGSTIDAAPDKKVVETCTSNQDCQAGFGAEYLCLDGTCKTVRSQDCSEAIGEYKVDGAWLVGVLLPTFGAHERSAKALRNATILANSDFSGGLPPLPGSTQRRAVGAIICNESTNINRAADFLVGTLGVKAILGPVIPGSTLELAEHLASFDGPFMITPSTVDLSSLPEKANVLRAGADDLQEATAIRSLFEEVLAPKLLENESIDELRLAVVHRDDQHGTGLRDAVLGSLTLNGSPARSSANQSYLIETGYGNPDAIPPVDRFATAIAAATQANKLPHVVIVIGQTEAAEGVIGAIESNWPSSAGYKAEYIVSHGLKVPELLDVTSDHAGITARLHGTAGGRNEKDVNASPFFIRYRNSFKDGSDPSVFGTTQVFDAFYLLAYGLAGVGKADFSGAELAAAVNTTMTAGATKVLPGPDGIPTAFANLGKETDEPIEFSGYSGDFSRSGDGVLSQIQIWHIDNNGALADTGMFLDAGGTSLEGN